MKKPYHRESLHFTREILNLRLIISWGRSTQSKKYISRDYNKKLWK